MGEQSLSARVSDNRRMTVDKRKTSLPYVMSHSQINLQNLRYLMFLTCLHRNVPVTASRRAHWRRWTASRTRLLGWRSRGWRSIVYPRTRSFASATASAAWNFAIARSARSSRARLPVYISCNGWRSSATGCPPSPLIGSTISSRCADWCSPATASRASRQARYVRWPAVCAISTCDTIDCAACRLTSWRTWSILSVSTSSVIRGTASAAGICKSSLSIITWDSRLPIGATRRTKSSSSRPMGSSSHT